MKKLLLATLTSLSIITVPAVAEERPDQGDDYRVEIHLECIMHPVLTGTDKKQNPYTKQEYETIDTVKQRVLLQTTRNLARLLAEEEFNEIMTVYKKVIDRLCDE